MSIKKRRDIRLFFIPTPQSYKIKKKISVAYFHQQCFAVSYFVFRDNAIFIV